MKKYLILLLAVFSFMATKAQTVQQPRTINVNGSAEMEIVPDEIYVQVELREYDKKTAGKTEKVDIDKIKNDFLSAAKSLGLKDEDVVVQGYSGYDQNLWWVKKNKKANPDMKASISYLVKLNTVAKMDELVKKLDDEATQNFYIQKVSHSKLTELKKQLKIQAVKAAKEKAEYLAEAIGEKVGHAISINDPNEVGYYPPRVVYANTMMKSEAVSDQSSAPAMNVDFKKMKLQFDVQVTFALQ
jgi:uncharacterized protein YggE